LRSRGSNHDNGANHDPHFFCPPSIVFQKPYMLFFTKYYVSWTPRDKNRSKPISRSRVYVGIWVRLRPVSSMLTNTCTSKFYVGAHIFANTEETGSITPHGLGRPSWTQQEPVAIVRAGEKVPPPPIPWRGYFPWWTPASEQSSARRGKKSPLIVAMREAIFPDGPQHQSRARPDGEKSPPHFGVLPWGKLFSLMDPSIRAELGEKSPPSFQSVAMREAIFPDGPQHQSSARRDGESFECIDRRVAINSVDMEIHCNSV